MADAPLEEIDANDPDLLRDPYEYFARLRREAPVFHDPKTGVISVSSHALVLEVNKKPKIFSSDMTAQLKSGGKGAIGSEEQAIMARGLPWVNTMLTADPPAHSRYKRLAIKAFTSRRVDAMAGYIRETTLDRIDGFASDGEVEFKAAFADKLPSIIIADLLGIPRADLPQFQIWLRAALTRLQGGADTAARIDAAHKEIELQRYLVDQIAAKRASPGDDVISDLAHATLAEEDNSRPLDDAELVGMLHQIFVAGQETTAQALTYGLYQMIVNPGQRDAALADPSLWAPMVEETLRHLTPTNNMWRIVKEDTVLGGVHLRAGQMLLLRYGAADRDEAVFDDPEAFDIHRENLHRHLAFGAGIHTCLGAALARKEMTIAFPLLFEKLPNLRLARGADSIRTSVSPLLRGFLDLHLHFDPA
tara:strand:- start:4646 stop:5902 length:1257 start_codon:yes stop_codon:yes gene_type:complete